MDEREREIVELRRQISELTVKLSALEALKAENAYLRRQLDKLVDQMAVQGDRLGEVASILRRREDQLRRGKGKRPDPDDEPDPPASGGGVSTGSSEGAEPPRKERKPRSGGGRKPVAKHLPVDTERVGLDRCGHCGSAALLARDTEVVEKYDVVREHVRRRQIIREVCLCKACNKTTTAPMPPMPWERSLITSGFLAWLVVQKFVLLVPLDRIRRMLVSKGIDLPMSTLVRFIEKAAALLDPIDGEHWKQLKSGPMLQVDGTSLKVLVAGQPEAHDGYIDVFLRGALTVFLFSMTKHSDGLLAALGDYRGRVVCDAESRMDALFADGLRVEANCNAHARRRFRDAEGAQPLLARRAGAFLTLMYDLERRAKGLEGDALLAWRQQRIRPVVTLFVRWMDRTLPKLLPKDPLASAIRYYRNHLEALTRFVDDPALPIDNNPCERMFQNHAKARLNWLFAGSVEGAHRYAVIAGVVGTALRCGLDVESYLTWVFDRRGTHRHELGLSAAELTPAAYQQSLEERRRDAA